MGLFNLSAIYIFLWDTLLVFANLVLPERPAGLMVHGQPVLGGKWPEYTPSQEQDSRCSCPALNALANHGIIPHNGRNISFVDLAHHVRATYNVSPTFCILILKFVARYTKKDYYNDTFELRELDAHNEIEHDGSLVREDIYFQPDTARIATSLIEDLLDRASGKDEDGKPFLTYSDLSKVLSQRIADSESTNPQFSYTFIIRILAWGNCAMMRLVFGGKVEDLRPFLLEERIADGWAPRCKSRYGVTLGAFNLASAKVALRTKANMTPTVVTTLQHSPDDNA